MRTSTPLISLAISLALGHAASAQVTINTATKYQTIDGFGFSEAFGFGIGVQDAPTAQQNQALTYLFDKTKGAGFTILRNRIAADPGNTIEPNSPGSPSAVPTYRRNGNDQSQVCGGSCLDWPASASTSTDVKKVFWSQKAREMGVEYIYADAWSAPGFMKTNKNYENGGYLCGVTNETCSTGDWRQAYANYLVKYIQDYESEGITIDFIGFLNEPEFAASYDAMLSEGTQAASFIPILHSAIQKAGLSTGIVCCDAEGWNDQVTYTKQIIGAGAEEYLSRISSHWYTSKGTSPINTRLRVWETEYADLDDAFSTIWHSSGAFNEGLTWAGYIYQGLVECNLSAFLYWIGAQSNSNAAGLVTLKGSGASMTVTPSATLWAFALFSRYIRPNAVRVAASGAPTNTRVAAFANADGTVAVVMLNQGSTSQSVTLGGVSIASAKANVMDNSVSSPTALSTSISNDSVKATLPGYSLVTFVITS